MRANLRYATWRQCQARWHEGGSAAPTGRLNVYSGRITCMLALVKCGERQRDGEDPPYFSSTGDRNVAVVQCDNRLRIK